MKCCICGDEIKQGEDYYEDSVTRHNICECCIDEYMDILKDEFHTTNLGE